MRKKLSTIHLRHAHVGDYEVHCLYFKHCQALFFTLCHKNLKTRGAEKTLQLEQDIGLVVDTQNDRRLRLGGRSFNGDFSHAGFAPSFRPGMPDYWIGSVTRKVLRLPTSVCTWCRKGNSQRHRTCSVELGEDMV